MKKLTTGLIVGLTLGFTSSVFALSLMTEAEMRAAIGQAGVSIEIGYIMFEQNIGSIAYTDDDGTTGDPGTIFISDQHTSKIYSAMVSESDYKTQFKDMTHGVEPMGAWNKFSALTIDVGKCTTQSAILNSNLSLLAPSQKTDILDAISVSPDTNSAANVLLALGTADSLSDAKAYIKAFSNVTDPNVSIPAQSIVGVVAGLPTLLISTSTEEFDIGASMSGAINDGDTFIHYKSEGNVMAILSGTIEIAAH